MANINKNIIMQAGAAVANATNKAAGLSTATPEPGSIISAIQLVNGGRTIGPAALAHFAESVRNKLLSLLVTMEPIQDLHGYSQPWPAGGGKNLAELTNPELTTNTSQKVATLNKTGTFNFALSFDLTNADCVENSASLFDLVANGSNNYVLPTSLRRVSDGAYWADIPKPVTGRFYYLFESKTDPTALYLYFESASYGKWSGAMSNVQLEIGTSPTAWQPYSNICPITGRTGLNVYAGPSDSIGDAATYSMDWTTPAGTIYGGSADVVSGDIKAAPYYAAYNGETLVGPWVSSMDVYDPEGTPTTGAQVVDLGGAMTEYHITGQDIITLVGDNYIWSDSGDVTITE